VPICLLNLNGVTHSKNLCEDDFKYLASTKFVDWKNFIITRYLRIELDIGQEKPLQKISEANKMEESDDFDMNDREI
jgi:hypothetical protein